MKNKKILVIIAMILILLIGVLIIFLITRNPKKTTNNYQTENKDNSDLKLVDNLFLEINSEVKLLSLINSDNTLEILSEDIYIDTSTLGEKELEIKYKKDLEEKIKTFKINIIDTTKPVITFKMELETTVGTNIDLLKDVFANDNSKEDIEVKVDGNYDFNKEGIYNLKYIAIDSSNNKTEEDFILKVNKKNTQSNNKNKPSNTIKPNNNKPNNNENNTSSDNNSNNKTISTSEFANQSIDFNINPWLTTVEFTWKDNLLPFTNDDDYIHLEIKLSGSGVNRTTKRDSYMEYDKEVSLNINSNYEVCVRAYQTDSNGNKVYTKETKKTFKTLSSPNYSSVDLAYVNNLFNEINNNRTNKYTRDAKLDLAAAICASSGNSSMQNAKSCLQAAGYSKAIFASMDKHYNPFYGKITYKEFYNKYADFYQKSGYTRIGVGYYQGVVHVISVSFCGDVDTTGLNTSTCN